MLLKSKPNISLSLLESGSLSSICIAELQLRYYSRNRTKVQAVLSQWNLAFLNEEIQQSHENWAQVLSLTEKQHISRNCSNWRQMLLVQDYSVMIIINFYSGFHSATYFYQWRYAVQLRRYCDEFVMVCVCMCVCACGSMSWCVGVYNENPWSEWLETCHSSFSLWYWVTAYWFWVQKGKGWRYGLRLEFGNPCWFESRESAHTFKFYNNISAIQFCFMLAEFYN